MPVDLSIPLLGKKKTVKDHIISILSSEWPLTSRKLYNTLTKKYNLSVSYQAVHKAIKELVASGIVVKNSKELQLNLDWINEVKGFSERIGEMYENGGNKIHELNLEEGEVLTIKFNSIAEMDKLLYYVLVKENCRQDRPDKCYNYWNYEYWPFFFMNDMIDFSSRIPHKENFFTILRNNTIVEKWTKKFYEKIGMHVKIGLNVANFDFTAFGDEFYQIFFPEELMKKLDKIFSNIKDMKDVDLDELKNIRECKNEIYMIFGKNKVIAEHLRNLFLNHFNGKNKLEHDSVSEAIFTKNSTEAMVFNSVHDVDKFILKFVMTNASDKRQELFLYWINSWVPVFIEKETYNKIVDVLKHYKIYSVIKNKTVIDRWCKKVIQSDVDEKIGIDLEIPDTIVLNDTVLQVFYPDKIKKDIFEAYSRTSDINELNIDKLFKTIFEKETTIPVVVQTNKALAKEIKNKMLEHY